MKSEEYQFPEYGGGGDLLGSRRSRRAFRWFIALIVSFTWMLWISERFLRYEHAEMLYINGIVLPPESGRNLLRQAVREDEQNHEYPSPRYVQALAEREEADLVLPTYERAYEYDPGNWALAIQYGIRLNDIGRAGIARARFRESGDQAPRNALPLYLEAAVIPWIDPANPNFTESLSLVARATGSDRDIAFPDPLWHPDLPASGYWYSELNRGIVRDCVNPLIRYAQLLLSLSQSESNPSELETWDGWLEHIQSMGRRLTQAAQTRAQQSEAGRAGLALLAQSGLAIELEAANERRRIAQVLERPPDEAAIKRIVELETAQTALAAFEHERGARIESDKKRFRYPLGWCVLTITACTSFSLALYVLSRLTRVNPMAGNVEHPLYGKVLLGLLPGAYLVLLLVIAVCQRVDLGTFPWMSVVSVLWLILLVGNLGFGILYPIFAIPPVSKVIERTGETGSVEIVAAARKGYRDACISLCKRYTGISTGWFLVAMCVWIVIYRILFSLFPWQTELLATGLESEERELLIRVLLPLL
ncbi:MAG: hypothetical protein AMXMBFR84_39850 [Candidatus Hydrogenedentota bacterium]